MKSAFPILTLGFTILVSCSKPTLEPMEVNPNLIRNGNFENQTLSLEMWSSDGAGEMMVDDLEAYEGNFAMYINPGSCMELFYDESVYVEPGAQYELSLAIKMEGEQTNCSGSFIMYVMQGSEVLLQFNIDKSNAAQWVVKKFYFTPATEQALTFNIISGVHDSFLDDVQLRKVGDIN